MKKLFVAIIMVSIVLAGCGSSKTQTQSSGVSPQTTSDAAQSAQSKDTNQPINKTQDTNSQVSKTNDTNQQVGKTQDTSNPVNKTEKLDKAAFAKFFDDTEVFLHEIDDLTNTTDPSKVDSVNASLDKVSNINDKLYALKVPNDPTGAINPYELQSYLSAYNLDFKALLIYKQLTLTNQATDIDPVEMTKKMTKDRELYTAELSKYREICK
ncbi:hypothetical protein [Desulfosporosinus sp. FKB]|uniref:hypothetical protein n=1 Tax=Desulfosporosinus sp. FKB TaxID=1969835 RepID=UPI000B49EC4D|nr:hypothetical protein [Desulfosporosinus sp. FKB]